MADLLTFQSCVLLFVVILVASFDRGEGQSVGTCYSTKDCSGGHYSAAGGRWTEADCCSLGGHPCWCDDSNNRCQPSCGSARQTLSSSRLGKCYPSKDCGDSSYSMAGGRWTKDDCCSVGDQCWCDEANVCRPSCGSDSNEQSSPLGTCYSSKYCEDSYSRASGKWTKHDCCSIGNPCWCDQSGVCQPSCSAGHKPGSLGKCYSTRDCGESYSAARGKWTKQDCCQVGSENCWCDQSGRCQSSCTSTDQQSTTPLVLGKCYSTSTCKSYSAAGGKWTKEDCCSLGHQCWCDEQGQCHPSCADSTVSHSILGKCYSSHDCRSYDLVGGRWSQRDCCLSGNLCWCDSSGTCHASCSIPIDDSDVSPQPHTQPWSPWSQATNQPTQSSGKHTVYWWSLMSLIVIWPLTVCAIYCVVLCCRKCGPTTINNINYVQVNTVTDSEAKVV